MHAQKPREIASRLLLEAEASAAFVEHRVDDELAEAGLSKQDRALCQNLVYGVIRWQRALDWLVARKVERLPSDPAPLILLRLGLYQMYWLDRVPDYACVNEMVELAKKLRLQGQAGFINAVLRRYSQERLVTQEALAQLRIEKPAVGYSHPDWLCEHWEKRWGRDNLIALLAWNNSPAPVYARVNTLKVPPARFASEALAQGIEWEPLQVGWDEPLMVGRVTCQGAIEDTQAFQDGWFYIQDPSTLLAVHELSPQPGERILDLCAAPGGKTTYIAQRMENRGTIVASDLDLARIELGRQNCLRLGVACATFVSSAELDAQAETEFDRVLLDAPCSNSGVFRRRIQARWRLTPAELGRLANRQKELLRRASTYLRPGGRLIYSTCSIEPEENDAIADAFLTENPEFELLRQRTLLPFKDGMDGAFVAVFERKD